MVDAHRTVVLLGAQRKDPTLGAAVAELGGAKRFALVTAGWQEREAEDEELSSHLGGRTVNLRLHARGEDVFRTDAELSADYRERQLNLRQSQECYRIRLEHALEADQTIRQRPSPPSVLREEIEASIASIRALDAWHLLRCAEAHRVFEEKWDLKSRPSVARHRQELGEILEGCDALCLAGGQVATLLNRLLLFDLASFTAGKTLFAWQAGAMAITERVVLFHEDPPQGPGAAEVLDHGLGLVPGVVVFPSPETRLLEGSRGHAADMVRRFEPARCLTLPARSYVVWKGGEVVSESGAVVLEEKPRPRPSQRAPSERRIRHQNRLAIEALVAKKPSNDQAREFVDGRRVPLVEGTSVTFLFFGQVDGVKLVHWTYGLEAQTSLTRVEGTDLFYLTLEIPERSRIEYKLEVTRGGQSEWVLDPKNPNQARDPFGQNSVLQSAGYERPPWTHPVEAARKGTIEPFTLESKALGGPRTGHVYLPARFRKTRVYPLLVVHDGSDYLRYASIQTVLDNLIHRLEIPDFIVALTDSPDRLREYAANEAHARYVTEELVPHLASRFPLRDQPEARCLMGASFGGIAAFSTAYRYPGFWGRLLLQSGSFAFTDVGRKNRRGPVFDNVVTFMNRYRGQPTPLSERVYVSCGVFESLIYENRSLIPLLSKTGMVVRFDEARDGHNWEGWRDRLREGLSWLFPGPLMFVYE